MDHGVPENLQTRKIEKDLRCVPLVSLIYTDSFWHISNGGQVNIKIGLTKGLGGSVARAGCKMRQCGSIGADDKPQRALQDENCFILSRSVGTGVNWAPCLEGEKDFPIQIPC